MIGHRTHLSINDKGNLEIGGVDVTTLTANLKTPLYVTDEERIRKRYAELHNTFSSFGFEGSVKYAYKANTSLAIIKLFNRLGAGADVLSEGEIMAALHIGVKSEDILFTGNNKTNEELALAIKEGITINVGSLSELKRIKQITAEENKKTKISFRINPAVSPATHPYLATGLKESKFGVSQKVALDAYAEAAEDRNLIIEGVHMHIGSQILDASVYCEATKKLMELVCKLKDKHGINLKFIDIGGGFGIKYHEKDRFVPPVEFANAVFPEIEKAINECNLKKPKIFIEPGRYLVADSTILLTTVNTIKKTPYKKFIGVDAGFNTLARPMIYGAYHEVVIANKMKEPAKEVVTIAGNVCESGDILAKDRTLPKIEEGDNVAFLDVGAYGLIMASQYNFRPRPASVLVNNGRWFIIRERETFKDLIEKENIPEESYYTHGN